MARTDVTFFYTSGAPSTDQTKPAQQLSTSSSSSGALSFSYSVPQR